jgi:hypothetical protein
MANPFFLGTWTMKLGEMFVQGKHTSYRVYAGYVNDIYDYRKNDKLYIRIWKCNFLHDDLLFCGGCWVYYSNLKEVFDISEDDLDKCLDAARRLEKMRSFV